MAARMCQNARSQSFAAHALAEGDTAASLRVECADRKSNDQDAFVEETNLGIPPG